MTTEDGHQGNGAFESSENSGNRGDTMRSTTWECLPEYLRTVLPELSDKEAVKAALGQYRTARETMSSRMTFESLLEFCTATRVCCSTIHDAWLFDVSGGLLGIGDTVQEFVHALESSDPTIGDLIERLPDASSDYRDT